MHHLIALLFIFITLSFGIALNLAPVILVSIVITLAYAPVAVMMTIDDYRYN